METGKRHRRLPLIAAIFWCVALSSFGHETGLSTADLKFATNGLDAELIFASSDFAEMLARSGALQPAANSDGQSTPKFLNTGLERLKQLATEALLVEFDGRRVVASVSGFIVDGKDNYHFQINFLGNRPGKLVIGSKLFPYLPEKHIQFVSVHDLDGSALGNKMLNVNDDRLQLSIPISSAGSSTSNPAVSTFPGFVRLGVEHIWTGYDHLLFLSALLLVCPNFKSAIQVVTCFTLAHSLTLAFATLNLVWVSSRVVEPAIAASIIYIGVENLLRPEGPKGRWLITFLFGLVHGLGFATVLRDMGVSSSSTGVALPLVGFNLGVEAGQLAVACLLLPLIWKLRNFEPFLKRGIPACSAIVAVAGCYWFAQRVFFV